jgi:hypothetical protein
MGLCRPLKASRRLEQRYVSWTGGADQFGRKRGVVAANEGAMRTAGSMVGDMRVEIELRGEVPTVL